MVALDTDLYLGGPWFDSGPGTRLSCSAFWCSLSVRYKFQGIATDYAQADQSPYFTIHYSVITQLCDTVYCELLPQLLNKPYIRSECVSVHDMKAYWGNRSMAPFILSLGTKWE